MTVLRLSWRTLAALGVSLVPLLSGACSGPAASAPGGQEASSAASSTIPAEPPVWRAGDRWTYEWTSRGERGTKTAEVVETREVNGVRYHVLRIGDLDHYYTLDLRWAAAVRDGKVAMRMTPPQPWFVWPLTPGRRWSQEGTWEDSDGKRVARDAFSVAVAETIEVPAGRFAAVKITRDGGSGVSDEYWYVPGVRFYARWIGRRNDVSFDERLTDFRPGPPSASGATPTPVTPRPPPR